MIEDSECAGVVYSPEFASEVEPALELAARKPDHRLRVEGEGHTMRSLMQSAPSDLTPAQALPTADCFWLYSSGTTGTPKGTVHAHHDMVVTSQYYGVDTLGIREDDVCFSGLGNAMTFPLWVGASSVLLPERPTPQSTFEVIEQLKPTVFFGVPTLYAAQLKALDGEPRNLNSLRYCVSAGEALPADIFRRWQKKTGTLILDGIGSTEALHIFISNRKEDYKAGTSGRIVPGYEAKILDDAGAEVSPGETGRLMIKGESTAKRYWNNPQRTALTMVDGWLNTGDTYFCDEDGYFHYCGRSDDMLKVGGIWCSPFEIEAKLVEHPKVLEAAVVGRADDDELIKPEAFVVLNNPAEASDDLARELLEHCKAGLAKYKYPRWTNFGDEIRKSTPLTFLTTPLSGSIIQPLLIASECSSGLDSGKRSFSDLSKVTTASFLSSFFSVSCIRQFPSITAPSLTTIVGDWISPSTFPDAVTSILLSVITLPLISPLLSI
jgi:benzoate-CoA ligase family protein